MLLTSYTVPKTIMSKEYSHGLERWSYLTIREHDQMKVTMITTYRTWYKESRRLSISHSV